LAEPFRFTTGRWYNRYDPDTGRTAKAPAYREGFTYDAFAYGSDTPEDFVPDGAPLQYSLICAKQTFLLVVDVDYPEALAGSATGALVSWQDALSMRGSHFHIGVDMRGAKEEDWPVQGRTPWGDIKSNGLVAAPGSLHFSGELYAPASADLAGLLVPWSPGLLAALQDDKLALALSRRAEWGIGATGTSLPDGSYLYASGYVRGTWTQLPDGALKHDDELKDLLWDMHVVFGTGENECRAQWDRLAGALGSDWTDKDFRRHWHKLPARRLEELEKDDATRFLEDFGLAMPAAPLQAVQAEQQQVYRHRTQQAQGFGPATEPPPDGPAEDDGDGISWFHYYLGYGPFDAGEPTDAGNAREVLRRSWQALRHDEEAGTWLKRVAGRWVQDDDAAKEAVTALGALLPADRCADPLKHPRWEHLDPEADAAVIAALKRHAKNHERFSASATVNSVAAMMRNIARARSEAWMTVRDSELDRSPEILWAGGIPWDLRACADGPVRAWHVDRSTPHLHSAACVPDASVPTPLWDELLREVCVDRSGRHDPWLAAWTVLVLSAGVTGYPKKAVPVFKGDRDRGKSTLVEAVGDVLGTYFKPLNSKILDAGASTHDTVLMELKGTRLTFLDEAVERGKMATARLKRLVGGTSITANRMRQDPVTFRPTHTLAITLNPEENFSFDDPAIESRIRLIPCNGSAERVIAVAVRLAYYQSPEWLAERPGVLAKLMSAAAALLADSHAIDKDRAPVSVQLAEQNVKDEEDDVLRWFLEATAEAPDGYPSRELYKSCLAWLRETKSDYEIKLTETKWGRRMNELVPEDESHPLYTANKSRLRRRKPTGAGSGGFGGQAGGFSAASFMAEGARPQPGSSDQRQTPVSYPPEKANPPANPPDEKYQVSGSLPVGTVGSVGITTTTKTKNPTPHTLFTDSQNGTGETHRPTGPTGTGLADPPERVGDGEPRRLAEKSLLPENGENGKIREKPDSPPKRKNPGSRLTPEEKAERETARKAKLAQARLDARAAKIAELGGPLVKLPAVVLRDQTVLETDAETASAFLEPVLGELSVDVEHSGFPRQHKDYCLRLVQLGGEHFAVVLDPSDPAQADVIRKALRAAKVLHAHSALADLIPLEAAGLCDATVWDRMYDTVNLAKLTDPALCDSDEAALKPLARKLLGDRYALSWKADEARKELFAAGGWLSECEVTTPADRSGWAQVPVCMSFVRYAASDVLDCAAVARRLQA
jgi:phage/plasmid-associated DNA primase